MTAIQTITNVTEIEQAIREHFLHRDKKDESMSYLRLQLGSQLHLSEQALDFKIEDIRANTLLDLMAEAERLARGGNSTYADKHTLAMHVATDETTGLTPNYGWVESGRQKLDRLYTATKSARRYR